MRFKALIAAISMLVLFYAVASSLILWQINKRFIGCSMRCSPPPTVSPWADPLLLGVGAIGPTLLIIEASFCVVRQHNRSRRGYCACCGRMLRHDLLRCLHCGTRVISGRQVESRFEVVIRHDGTRTRFV